MPVLWVDSRSIRPRGMTDYWKVPFWCHLCITPGFSLPWSGLFSDYFSGSLNSGLLLILQHYWMVVLSFNIVDIKLNKKMTRNICGLWKDQRRETAEIFLSTPRKGVLVLINSKNLGPLWSMRRSLSCVSNFLSCLYCCYIKLCSDEKHLLKKSECTIWDYVSSSAWSQWEILLSPPAIVPTAPGTFCVWHKALDRDALA